MGRLTLVSAHDDSTLSTSSNGLHFGDSTDSVPFPCLRINARGIIEAANPTACELLGLNASRRGTPVLSAYVAPASLGPLFQFVREVHSTLSPVRATVRVRSTSYEEYDVQLDGRQLEGMESAMVSMVDVTEQRRTIGRISENERRLRGLLETLPDAVFVVRDDIVLEANSAARRLVGMDVVASSFSELLVEEQRELAANWPPRNLRRTAQRHELCFTASDGAHRVTDAMWSIGSLDGEPALVCVARDCTAQKRIDGNVAHRDRLATVGMLAAGVAHEINNPLTYITMNLAELAASLVRGRLEIDPQEAEEMASSAQDALDGARRIARIVGDLQGVSRVDDELGPVNVNAVVERVLNLMMPHTIQRAEMVARLGHVEPAIADDGRMVQVVLNLVMNAAQAVPSEGGRIEVSTAMTRDAIEIRVRDNGPGIAANMIHRLFEPFATTKDVGEGSGLGLYVCHRYVTACGGEIEALSPADGGAEFRIRLRPSTAEAQAILEEEEDAPQRASIAAGQSVLIVEDEPAIARSIAEALAVRCKVEVVDTARRAIDALKAQGDDPFSIILCDLALPGGSGREVYQYVQRYLPAQLESFGLMTGGAVDPLDSTFLETSSVPCLRKPFSLQELIDFASERSSQTERSRALSSS